MNSRRAPDAPNILPLLTRLSMARSTSGRIKLARHSLSKCPCSSNVGPGEGAEFNRVGDPRRKGSSRHPRDWTAWFVREMRRTLKLIDKSGGLIARNRGAGAWGFTDLVSPRAFNQGEIESVRVD